MRPFLGISKLRLSLAQCRSAEPLATERFAEILSKRGERFTETDDGIRLDKSSAGMAKGVGLPTPKRLRQLVEARGMEWDKDYPNRAFRWWGSDETVDHMGDILRQNWDFGVFTNNSPMPFSHEWHKLPVGRYVDWTVAERETADGETEVMPALNLLGVFLTESVYPWAEQVCSLVRAGALPMCSVGLISRSPIHVQDEEEREALGLGEYGLILDDNVLLECSPCTIPANANAGLASVVRGLDANGIELLRDFKRQEIRRKGGDTPTWQNEDNAVVAAARVAHPDYRPHSVSNIDNPVIGEEPMGVKKTQVPVTKDGEEDTALASILEMQKSIVQLLEALLESQKMMATALSAVVADLQTALDSRTTDENDEEEDDEEEEDEDETGKSLSGSFDDLAALRAGLNSALGGLAKVRAS